MKRIVLAVAAAAALMLAPAGSGHVRTAGNCDAFGYCELFFGVTVSPGDHSNVIDPINVAWYPYGSASRVRAVLNNEFGWTHECGSSQANRRLLGSMSGGLYWAYANQNAQQGSSGCPNPAHGCFYIGNCDRWHARVFQGHTHDSASNNWSVSDAHHENHFHRIDRSWEVAEDEVARRASAHGHAVQDFWTYLPRADATFQGYASNGWTVRVNAG